MKHFFLTLCIGLLCIPSVQAQDGLLLTLDACIERALANSPASEIARLRFEQSQWGYRAFQSEYRPAFSLNGNTPGLERSISEIDQDDGSVRYVPQNRTFSRANISIFQPIPQTGGQVFVSSGLSRVDQFGGFEFNQWQSTPIIIGLNQPIFDFNPMKWNRRLMPLQHRIAQRTYAEDHADIALDITDRFFDVYMAQMNRDNAAFNVAVNDTIYILSTGRYDIGTIAENDLLQSELALLNAQTELSNAETNYERALQNLKLALGMPYDTPLEVIPPLDIPNVNVDPNEAVVQAAQNRAAFLDLERVSMEAERNLDQAEHINGFSASLTAQYGLNQSAESFDNAYRNPLSQQRFSLNFQVPIFQWGRGDAEVAQAYTERAQTEENIALQRKELEQEVYFEAIQLLQLQQQVRIAAKADTVGARRFEVARNRYGIGKIDVTNLFDAQREKDGARQAFIQTLRQYWISYFRLRRLTLFDFENQQPLTGRFD